MKGRKWGKSLAVCMALAIVACSTPMQSTSELVNGLALTARALDEPATESEQAESTIPVDEEMQETEAPTEEAVLSEEEAAPVEETTTVEEATTVEETPTEAEAIMEEAPVEPEESAPAGESVQVEGESPLATTNGVSYISRSWDASSKQIVETQATYAGQYKDLPNYSFYLTGSQEGVWYYVDKSLMFNIRLQVTGKVNLIIGDDVTLDCEDGIRVPSGSELNIYFQSKETGVLIAMANGSGCAGIGGSSNENSGTINIYGGTVKAYGGDEAAGIGGGYCGAGGTVNIYGGNVFADGSRYAAGIGGGYYGNSGNITINGGTVEAYGRDGGAGIGGGYYNGYYDGGSNITINGGTVNAYGRDGGAGIGDGAKSYDKSRSITINGGDITAVGGANAAGIGGGYKGKNANLTITVKDCEKLDAMGGTHAAGIGGGYYYANSGKIVIDGGSNISAKGGIGDSSDAGGAGVGTGAYCFQTDSNAVNVTINGGTIEAVGGSGYVYGNKSYNLPGAAIGAGGYSYFYGSIKLNGGDITAVSGDTVNNYGSYDTSSAPKNTTSAIGTTTEKYFSDGSGSVNFNGATVTMKLKPDLTGKYPASVRANSIAINDASTRQCVVYSDDINEVYASYAERKEVFGKEHSYVRVAPCTHHADVNISISDTQHRLQCKYCGKDAGKTPENHVFNTVEWKWSSDFSSAQAIPTCSECGHHKSPVNASVTSRAEVIGTIYTATVTIDGTTYTDEQTKRNATVAYHSATYDPSTNSVSETSKSTNQYFTVTKNSTAWTDSTYVVKGNVTISERIKVSGNVNLILCDGATLTVQKGIETDSDAMLNIYAQSAGTGKLIAKGKDGSGLYIILNYPTGESGDNAIKGNVTIYGGVIQATGGNGYYASEDPDSTAPPSGGSGGSAFWGNITVYKGNIKATGGSAANAGLGNPPPFVGVNAYGGSGASGLEGSITIYGGTFDLGATRIGEVSGHLYLSGGTIPTNGAKIKASQAVIYGGTFTNGNPFRKVDAVAPTYTATGTVEHYLDTAGNLYLKDGYTYTQTTVEGITAPKIPLKHYEAVEPICSEGNIEYWHDETNHKYFSDPNGKHEVQSIIAPHSDYAPVWEWGENHTSAQAVFICERCGRQNKIDAMVSQNNVNGNTVYTAECTYEGKYYTSKVYTQSIPYQTANYDETQNKVNFSSQETARYYLVDQNSTRLSGTYVVKGNVTIDAPIAVLSNVDLIICDGATLTVNQGIEVKDGMLSVYGQSEGTGKLIVGNTDLISPAVSGSVTIHGGIIEAKGGNGKQGYGKSNWAKGNDGYPGAPAFSCNTVIYDGTIKAIGGNGGKGGAGITPGSPGKNGAGFAGSVTIYGGTFEKTDREMYDPSVKAAIYGGTFAAEPSSKYLAAGHAVTNTEGKYVVVYDPSAAVKPSDRGDNGDDGEDYTATVTRKDSENPPAFTINAAPVSLSDIFDVTLTDADDEPLAPVWEAKETTGIQIDEHSNITFTAPGTYHIRVHDPDEIVYSEWQEIVVESGAVTPEDKEPIADETLLEWVKVDYEKNDGTAVYPEITSKSYGAYEIYVKDQDGEVLDIYTVDPTTGIGESRINPEVNLPQTGIDLSGSTAAVGGALALTAAGIWLLCRGARRKNDEQ